MAYSPGYNFIFDTPSPNLTEDDPSKKLFSKISNIQQDEPIPQGQYKEKVKRYTQARESYSPTSTEVELNKKFFSKITNIKQEEPIPQGQYKEKVKRFTQERESYTNEIYSEKKRSRPVANGDVLLARESFSGKPALTFRDGAEPFFGFQQEPHPIQRVVNESNTYTGIKTFTVDGITFSVDFTNYKDIFAFLDIKQ